MALDIVIRNARVVDGTGTPWFKACVGISKGKIVELDRGQMLPGGEVDIDARGKYLTPGLFKKRVQKLICSNLDNRK